MSAPEKTGTPVYKFSFTGGFGEVLLLTLKNTIFTIFTLGLYLPYARTNMRKYVWKSTKLNKHPFLFHADPKKLMKGYFILGCILVASFMLSTTLSLAIPVFGPIFKLIPPIVIFAIMFRARYNAYAYLVNNSSYRSIRFHAKKDAVWDYMAAVLKGSLLTIFTLGFYAPCVSANLSRIKWTNTSFGNMPFRFEMKNWDFALVCYKNIFFCMITLGLYTPWAVVAVHKYKIAHLRFQGAKFESTATGWSLIGMQIRSTLLLICSLGLAFPYVMNMVLAYYVNNLRMKGTIDFDGIVQNADKQNDDSLSDSVADVFDVDVDVA